MRILVVVGTRPEAIKMLPLARELKKHSRFEVFVCHSGQHEDMCRGIFEYFGIEPDIKFSVMKSGQPLCELSLRLEKSFGELFDAEKFDIVLVHGDTTTAFCASLAAFYRGIKVAHVEAGLRTHKREPFPEEFNRVAIDRMSSVHFPPTEDAVKNLEAEGIFGTQAVGNTVIDALLYTIDENYRPPILDRARGRKIILVTAHRRENLGNKMKSALLGIGDVLKARGDMFAIFPVHPNPQIRSIVKEVFDGVSNIELCEPLFVRDFHNILARSFATVTDSGGIQEEAAYLGIPVFLMRDETERAEALSQGNICLVGTDRNAIFDTFCRTVEDKKALQLMQQRSYAYGRGDTCKEIVKKLLSMERNNDIIN